MTVQQVLEVFTLRSMDSNTLGRALIAAGLLIAVAGAIVYFGGKVGYFGLGKLPGDIRIERESVRVYFPITTSIIVSIVLSAIFYLLSRLR